MYDDTTFYMATFIVVFECVALMIGVASKSTYGMGLVGMLIVGHAKAVLFLFCALFVCASIVFTVCVYWPYLLVRFTVGHFKNRQLSGNAG